MTNFPTSLDTLTNPTATDPVTNPSHATQHANANDAIEALEAKVGINSSATTTSHDYKLSLVTASDKAVSLTGTETLSGKTLTTPVIASMYQDAGLTKLMTVPNTASDTLTANAATQTLTNKTATATSNNITAKSLHSATTVVDVSASTAPTSGQVLTATGGTAATWQTPSAGAFSGASVTTAGGTITTNTTISVAWNGESFDTGTYHDNSTNNERLTAPSTGYYLVTCTISHTSSSATIYSSLQLRVDGSTIVASTGSIASNGLSTGGFTVSAIVYLTSTQYVEARLSAQASGLTYTYSATGSYFSIAKIGA